MKNRFLLLFGAILVIAACNKTDISSPSGSGGSVSGCMDPNSLNYNAAATVDDGSCIVPENKQNAFILEYTETACHYCGAWGCDTMHGLLRRPNTVGVSCHSSILGTSDPMLMQNTYNDFLTCRPCGGVPDFYVGNTEITTTTGYTPAMNTLWSTPCTAGICFTTSVTGNTMTVKTMTEFFKPGTGDYYLSVYVCESGIDGSASSGAYAQSGALNPATYKHDFVLRRTNVTDKAYGEKIITGSAAVGKTVSKTYSLPLDPTWNKAKLFAVAVLWHLNGTVYEYVNAKQYDKFPSY